MTNETLKAIRERSSCKAFMGELPEQAKIDAIAEAALASPSATNKQPWRVVVVTNRELIDEIEDETVRMMGETPGYEDFHKLVTSTGMKLFYNAPCMIVLPIDGQNPYAAYDCGIASQSISIAAQSLGVGSHIIAISELAFSGEKGAYLKERLGFPEGYRFGLAVLIGDEESHAEPHQLDEGKVVRVR